MNKEKTIAYLIIAGLWIYVVLRAVFVPIGIDEANTFFHYVQPNEWLPGIAHWDANNHILNSALSVLSFHAFGANEWALRLPNVFAGLLYLIMAWQLALRLAYKWSRWGMFISLSTCSFLLQYFGYMRGYGLSLALLLTAIWLILKLRNGHSTPILVTAFLSIWLMVYANLSLLIMGLLLICVIVLWSGGKGKLPIILSLLGAAISPVILYPAINHSFGLKERGLLYFGEGDSFWDVTVRGLSQHIYHPFGEYLVWLFPVIVLVIIFSAIAKIKQVGVRSAMDHPAFLPVVLLFGSLLANISMHHLLGVNYPKDRVALPYIPIMFTSMFFLTDGLKSSGLRALLLAMAFVSPIQLLASANVSKGLPWENSQYLPELLKIVKTHKVESGVEPTVAVNGWRNVAYDYDNWRSGGEVSPTRIFSGNGYLADLVLTNNDKNFDLSDYAPLCEDPWSDLIVYERKTPWKRILLMEGVFDTDGQTDAEFKELVNTSLPENRPAAFLFVPKVTVQSTNIPLRVSLMGQVSNKEHQGIDSHELALDRIRPKWSGETTYLNQTVLLDTRSDSAASLKIFLWNREGQGSYEAHGTWKLYELR